VKRKPSRFPGKGTDAVDPASISVVRQFNVLAGGPGIQCVLFGGLYVDPVPEVPMHLEALDGERFLVIHDLLSPQAGR
jgi:hypothetical protein